jgi:hypothetical protein
MSLSMRRVPCVLLLCLCTATGWAQPKDEPQKQTKDKQQQQQQQAKPQQQPKAQPQPQQPSPGQTQQPQQQPKTQPQQTKDQQQMRGLDEEVQQIKSDVLSITQELQQLEEKLLYPSGTQVAVFVSLAKGDTMRLDAVRLQIDGQLVAHYIYSAKELEALRKGGVQRVYVGNVATGDHQLEVVVEGKLDTGADFSRTGLLSFRKDVRPKMVGLTLAGSGDNPIALGEW